MALLTSLLRPGSLLASRGARIAAGVVAVVALAVALQAGRARSLATQIDSRRVAVGHTEYLRPDPADVEPFEPFSFVLCGPAEGDDSLVERALTDDSVTVLVGDVARSEADYTRINATLGDALVVAAPGPRDLAHPEEFGALVSAEHWWFVRRECLFVGLAGDADADRTFLAEALAEGVAGETASRHVFVFHGGVAPEVSNPDITVFGPLRDAPLRRVHVATEGVTIEPIATSAFPTWGAIDRATTLGWLAPRVAGSTGAFVALLAGCTVVVALGASMAFRRARPS